MTTLTNNPDQTLDQTLDQAPAAQPARHAGWLWISAGVLAALTLIQGAGLLDRPAMAEMVAEKSGYVVMTTDGGTNQILAVLDERNEALMIYSVANRRQILLQDRQSLPEMFVRARANAGLPPRP
jgi:hypothetical protein